MHGTGKSPQIQRAKANVETNARQNETVPNSNRSHDSRVDNAVPPAYSAELHGSHFVLKNEPNSSIAPSYADATGETQKPNKSLPFKNMLSGALKKAKDFAKKAAIPLAAGGAGTAAGLGLAIAAGATLPPLIALAGLGALIGFGGGLIMNKFVGGIRARHKREAAGRKSILEGRNKKSEHASPNRAGSTRIDNAPEYDADGMLISGENLTSSTKDD